MSPKPAELVGQEQTKHWLWVAKPRYYLEEDGVEERYSLDPASEYDSSGGWWTCHKDTQRGDLILFWRTSPKCDIGYLIQAASDAYSLTGEAPDDQPTWQYGCEYQPIYKFSNPLTISEIRKDPYLDEWSALRGRFQRQTFLIRPDIWAHLIDKASAKEPRSGQLQKLIQNQNAIAPAILREEELEQRLYDNLAILKKIGFDLELLQRQEVCVGYGGRIDLLCYDRKKQRHVVIELKNVRAGRNTFGQVVTYMAWVNQHYSPSKPPLGLVIARGADKNFELAATTNPDVKFCTLEDIGFQ